MYHHHLTITMQVSSQRLSRQLRLGRVTPAVRVTARPYTTNQSGRQASEVEQTRLSSGTVCRTARTIRLQSICMQPPSYARTRTSAGSHRCALPFLPSLAEVRLNMEDHKSRASPSIRRAVSRSCWPAGQGPGAKHPRQPPRTRVARAGHARQHTRTPTSRLLIKRRVHSGGIRSGALAL